MVELVLPNSKVIEFGCGNGDLLFKLAPRISDGLGIDLSESLIAYAEQRRLSEGMKNIVFERYDLAEEFKYDEDYDYAIASLLLHVMPQDKAIALLKRMLDISATSLICEFVKPENLKQSALLWMDQRFSGHYQNFKTYQQNNYMDGLLQKLPDCTVHCYDTFDPVIKIYKLKR